MAKKIIINANMAEEVRIAILENDQIIDLDIETSTKAKHKGNIYKGIVSNIEDGLEAAFIDIGEDKQAFLPLSEIRPAIYPEHTANKKKVKISDVLYRGQEIIVQVTKDEIGNKGAAVSTYLSLPGRFVVLMHSDESGGGISRKIESESARSAARTMLSHLNVPSNMAVIIRTAGMNCNKMELFKDFKLLCQTWEQIDKAAQIGRAPTLLYREPDIVIKTIRDYFSSEVSLIVIDDEEEYEEALSYFKENMPDLVPLLEKHKKREPIFHHYGIEKALSELFDLEVKLPSGGYITIEQTEALVAIDVNSGSSTKEEDHEATVYKTNLEAADEIARQLRLRDMGGIVIIDFIDMVSRWHRRDVERRLRDLMRNDKARVKFGRISENGVLELTRQRIRQSHSLISRVICSSCNGTGRVRDTQGLSLTALRKMHTYLARKRAPLTSLTVKVPVEVANLLNNRKRKELLNLSEGYETNIDVIGDIKLSDSQIEFYEERRGFAGLKAKSTNNNYTSSDSIKRIEQPAPSIGPAPSIIEEDFNDNEENLDLIDEKENYTDKEFSDVLSKALFASAPQESIEELLSLCSYNYVEQQDASFENDSIGNNNEDYNQTNSEESDDRKLGYKKKYNTKYKNNSRYRKNLNKKSLNDSANIEENDFKDINKE